MSLGGDSSFPSETAWPDLYALLDIAPDAAPDELRARIRAAFLEATNNADHRHVERRAYFQMMGQRIVPQARRILLDERTRRAYDRQLALHQQNDASAIPYTQFVAHLAERENENLSPDASVKIGLPASVSSQTVLSHLQDESSTGTANAPAMEAAQHLFDQAHDVLRSEKKFAEMAPIPSFAADLQAAISVPDEDDETPRENPSLWDKVAPRAPRAISIQKPSLGEDAPPMIRVYPTDIPSLNSATPANSSTRSRHIPNTQAAPKTVPNVAPQNVAPQSAATENVASQNLAPHSAPQSESSTRLPNLAEPNAATTNAYVEEEVPILERADSPETDSSETDSAETSTQTEPTTDAEKLEDEARRARVLRVERGPRPLTSEQVLASGGQDLGDGFRGLVSSGRASDEEPIAVANSRKNLPSRVSVGAGTKESPTAVRWLKGQRVLSQPALLGLTALTSAALMFLILRLQRPEAPVVVAPPVVRIVYSSDLQSFMERARQGFAKTPQGQNVDLDLRPVDSRDGMHLALSGDNAPKPNANNAQSSTRSAAFDVWIPGETLWSDRFNQVAPKSRKQPISAPRSLADSPLVLIARDDHAQGLKRRFPNHIISSWEALRSAVVSDAAGHFGLTDPQKSGSGLLARTFMAREWCERNKVSWNANAAKDARLWKWMSGFEDNVPQYSALTSDMVKDLVVGNSDRFWWAVGYESDAITWMRAGKSVQVFYLPRTAYAEYPFCVLERDDVSSVSRRARSDFESFLRSRAMQNALVQNGFRPTEIRLADVKDNPFARKDFRARGLKESGFRVDQRLNYEVLNALNVQWSARYK